MVFGHKDKIELFKSLVERDGLRNAYLFFGEPQTGKFHFAKHLAYFLEYGEFQIDKRPLVDATFISPEGRSIGALEMRALKGHIFERPLRSPRRLVVVDDAERLTPEAQSSVLKLVEDAPSQVTFIFITWDPQVLLPPLSSRLLGVYFKRFSKEEIEKILVKDLKVDKKKVQQIASQSFGRIGYAIELLEGNEEKGEKPLRDEIDEHILSLYMRNKRKYSDTLSWLLKRQSEAVRFNLNPNLQRKVIDERLPY